MLYCGVLRPVENWTLVRYTTVFVVLEELRACLATVVERVLPGVAAGKLVLALSRVGAVTRVYMCLPPRRLCRCERSS